MHSKLFSITALFAVAALAGCVGDAGANSTLYVKDALTDDVAEVHVTFTKAQVKAADAGWTTVFEGKETIELLSLSAADAKEQLASFDLAEGSYDGLRIAVSEVRTVDHEGNETMLNVFGNLVQIADDFVVDADGIEILVDFDLEAGVDMDAGTYTPIVKDIQTSDDDADGDGIDDVDDTDDDDDGREDNEDDDADGDGEDDEPKQVHAASDAEACEAEIEEERSEIHAEFAEDLAELEDELGEVLDDANATEEEQMEALDEFDAEAAELEAERDEELAELEMELDECLTDDDDDDEREDDDDESDDESEQETESPESS